MQNDENRIDVSEGATVALPLQRNDGVAGAISVIWQALPGQARLQDYAPSTGTVTFSDGQQSAVILININSNADNENLEVISYNANYLVIMSEFHDAQLCGELFICVKSLYMEAIDLVCEQLLAVNANKKKNYL